MKLNQYLKKSLSRQFLALMGMFILLLLISAYSLFVSQKELNETYFKERQTLVHKEDLVEELDDSFYRVLFNIRGYFAFEIKDLKTDALAQLPNIRKLQKELETIAVTQEDKAFARKLDEFIDYYFNGKLPSSIDSFESGQIDEVIQLANSGTIDRINIFQKDSRQYLKSIKRELNENAEDLIRKQSIIHGVFIAILVILLLVLFRIIQVMFKQVGQPLAQFAHAANDIAAGKDAAIKVDSNREDELGALSIAFRKMVESIQEKEQDLMAQNEELIAQQDELQAQQIELEAMLDHVRANERKLERRNALTNKISNSLHKQEVLESIVSNMCFVLEADRGIIAMLSEDASASFGVSSIGVEQFKGHLTSGLHERLKQTRKAFSIKRELLAEEKGYHEALAYCYDLYLPVISSLDELVAVMVFSRFGSPFHNEQMEEYEALSKQIGLSLDKIRLYESSEEDRKLNQDIMNTVKEGIQVIDKDGRIIQVNNQLCELFQWQQPLDSLIGLQWEEWTNTLKEHVEDETEFVEFFRKAINNELVEEHSFTFKMKHQYQVINMYFEELYHEQEFLGTVLVHRDITKEFEVDHMKSEFVSTVSHELRTPLASILGFTELLLNRELKPAKQKKYLTTIYNETKRLSALINDFLDVQRMEAGKQIYEKKYIKLVPIIEKVIEDQQIQTGIHRIELNQTYENDLILGDRSKMEHVFTNLINNAIKYSPAGGEIKINVYQEGTCLKVDVIDQGLGIPEDAIDSLFTKFFRVDNSDRRTIGGTGLGLAIVQEIIKALDGEVKVYSRYGEGSTFSLSFPAIESVNHMSVGDQLYSQGTGYNIMVVEDDQSLAELMINELAESGFQVEHFEKGSDALDYVRVETPDAIVLDIMLEEEVDGWSIMKKLKESERLKHIPIIISTALDEKEKGFSLGAIDYLVKPYKPSHLSRAIMQTLLKIGKVGQILIPEDKDGN
ncbi:response regulator [Bacillus sp. FJAT-29790]|uniref:ATP-binding protein n=1 Tax=Bacillus sp. FJAT-29790 TaxID=1895002 RepID=UPI001C21F482|nr:ATP-binding protein [Bacillus sp. FJAT-29790]MBU8881039.1 response regulator [Bacillus sp. FJAT-29790]